MTMMTDIEIARGVVPRPIAEIGAALGISEPHLSPYGHDKAKISADFIAGLGDRPTGKLILVTAVSPTAAGEGKTTTTVGLGDGLSRIGRKVAICIREPSLGPCFGMKGGAAGGGRSQVIPMDDINLHFTGDFHAVTVAHNLLSAMIDNHIYWGNSLDIDQRRVTWRRVVDLNDRALRQITASLGGVANGFPRETGFDITVASEVMAILCLATDLNDLRSRLADIVIGSRRDRSPVYCRDLKAEGAMTVLLQQAMLPNLVQTLEHTPALVHGGPFANIAHGCNSVVATASALKLADYVITEAGFGADLGAEKFFDIKCRASGLMPDAAVLVTTIRALKMHGGGPQVVAGRPLDQAYLEEDLGLLEAGLVNLRQHLKITREFGVPVVVAINRFENDSQAEVDLLKEAALEAGAFEAVVANHWAEGGAGALELARAVVTAADEESSVEFLYPAESSIQEKLEAICTRVYGADGVDLTPAVQEQIERYSTLGFANLPICIAKTHLSLSHNPRLKGTPSGFRVPIREIRASVGAGFLYALAGTMRTMPGLPTRPAFFDVDIDAESGKVMGLI